MFDANNQLECTLCETLTGFDAMYSSTTERCVESCASIAAAPFKHENKCVQQCPSNTLLYNFTGENECMVCNETDTEQCLFYNDGLNNIYVEKCESPRRLQIGK